MNFSLTASSPFRSVTTHGIISPGMRCRKLLGSPSTSIDGMWRSTSTQTKVSWCCYPPRCSVIASSQPTSASLWVEAIKLSFKVRLCIEGVPHHARQPPIIRKLLHVDSLFDCIDFNHRNDKEAQCCYVTVWSRNPNNIVKEAALWLEEIQGRPAEPWHFVDLGSSAARRPRSGPVHLLSYDILVHIDQIVDFRAPTEDGAEWLEWHSFKWRIGVLDGLSRPLQRRSIQDRLGPLKRDRSSDDEECDGADGCRGCSTGIGLRGPFVSRPSTNAISHRPRRGPPARVWTRKSSPAPAHSELAGHVLSGPLPGTPTLSQASEPLPWDMAHTRPALPPTTHSSPVNPQPLPNTPLSMHQLLAALPDPMFLESTLPMPTTPIISNPSSKQVIPDSLQPRKLAGPNGEVWLPADPFHGYDDPSSFSPGTEWQGEWLAHNNRAEPDATLDSDAETANLPSGLLDSPP
jgi:hypothetical protein